MTGEPGGQKSAHSRDVYVMVPINDYLELIDKPNTDTNPWDCNPRSQRAHCAN
jgi:hypothetical protein